jgi:polysaccharide export outer membrane protein
MNRLIIKALGLLIILVFTTCASHRGVYLVDLTTKESPSETKLILTTTDPVPYHDMKLGSPPSIIIYFPENRVFSNNIDELVINKGGVKKIKYEYSKGENESQYQLNFMIVELSQDLPYKISNSGSSIIIRIENPSQSSVVSPKEQINIEVPVQVKNESLSTRQGYLIGPEDVLSIEVWNHPDVSRDVIVNHEGKIRLPPGKKNISVMGLNTSQLEEKLVEALSIFLIEPVVFVTVKEYNSQRVIALGETAIGMYTLKRPTTLVEFLGQIGGPNEDADTSRIRLIKKDGTIFTYNMNDLINTSQKRDPVFVSGGDTVYVPPIVMNKLYILGEVNSPKVLEFKEKLTLVEAIAEAGGYTGNAVLRSIIVIRGELGSHKGMRLNLKRILKKGDIAQNIELKPGDIVYVPRTFIANVERFLRLMGAPITWYLWFLR